MWELFCEVSVLTDDESGSALYLFADYLVFQGHNIAAVTTGIVCEWYVLIILLLPCTYNITSNTATTYQYRRS